MEGTLLHPVENPVPLGETEIQEWQQLINTIASGEFDDELKDAFVRLYQNNPHFRLRVFIQVEIYQERKNAAEYRHLLIPMGVLENSDAMTFLPVGLVEGILPQLYLYRHCRGTPVQQLCSVFYDPKPIAPFGPPGALDYRNLPNLPEIQLADRWIQLIGQVPNREDGPPEPQEQGGQGQQQRRRQQQPAQQSYSGTVEGNPRSEPARQGAPGSATAGGRSEPARNAPPTPDTASAASAAQQEPAESSATATPGEQSSRPRPRRPKRQSAYKVDTSILD